jgi:hypothetical protein
VTGISRAPVSYYRAQGNKGQSEHGECTSVLMNGSILDLSDRCNVMAFMGHIRGILAVSDWGRCNGHILHTSCKTYRINVSERTKTKCMCSHEWERFRPIWQVQRDGIHGAYRLCQTEVALRTQPAYMLRNIPPCELKPPCVCAHQRQRSRPF